MDTDWFWELDDSGREAFRERIAEYEAEGYRDGGIDYSSEEWFENMTYIIDPDGKKIPGTTAYDDPYSVESWRLLFEQLAR